LLVRPARAADLDAVTALEAVTSGTFKPEYWREIFARLVLSPSAGGFLLVAEVDGAIAGFIVGEVRAWEFGSPPSGWISAVNVEPRVREHGVGSALFEAACTQFKRARVNVVRTMVARSEKTTMSFFRSQGMTSGPYIELERTID
jgi:ribosomal protein S18 acetylase RimI-like enzyme